MLKKGNFISRNSYLFIFSRPKIFCFLFLFLFSLSGCGDKISITCNTINESLFGCTPTTPAPPAAPLLAQIFMWVTANLYDGDLGGVAGADTICTTEAAGAGLPLPAGSYTHRALISDSTQDIRTIINGASGPIERPNNTPIINTWTNYFDNTVTSTNAVIGVARTMNTFVWGGMDTTGTPSTLHCNNWTSDLNTDMGNIADANWDAVARLEDGDDDCNIPQNILCISY